VKHTKILKIQQMAFFELCPRDNFDKTLFYPKVPTYKRFPLVNSAGESKGKQ